MMKIRSIHLIWAAVAAAALAAATATPVPEVSDVPDSSTGPKARPAINAGALQSFFDEEVPRLMDENHVVGMVVSAVHGGGVAFERGYGHADIESGRGVEPDGTLFRVGSISKLFAWVAILQLAQRGRLDLDEDINTYLKVGDFHIADTFPDQPITLSHIMSHTPGFEDFLFNLFVKDHRTYMTLEEAIKEKRLRRVRPPGVEISYSNYGAMLAGYIVQLVSGASFESYVEEHIFKPLDMNRSTFRQPLPSELNDSLSKSYAYDGGNFTQWPHFEFVQGTSAGSMTSSASDMAKFLLAQLSPDCGGILKEETVGKFHSTLFRPDPRVNGMAHGVMELGTNGQRVLGHGGDLIYMHSVLAFIPEEDFGFFLSVNTGGAAARVAFKIFRATMDHFYPSPTGRELSENFEACTDLSLYPGTYLANRRSQSNMAKLMSLGMNLKIGRTKNETLKTFNFFLQEYQEYVEIEQGLFQEVDGQGKITFLSGEDGTVEGLIWANLPVITFKRPPLWELPIINAGILVVTAVLVLWGLIMPPFGLAVLVSRCKTPQPDGAVTASMLVFAVSLLNIIFVISLALVIDDTFIFAGVPPAWPFLIPWVIFLVGLLLPWHTYHCWKRGFWGRKDRIFYLVFTIDMHLWFGMLWYWCVVPQFW